MNSRVVFLSLAFLFVFLAPKPDLRAQQPSSDAQHEQHHPGDATPQPGSPTGQPQADMMNMMSRMRANDAKLDELVKRMNSANGTAKTEAIAQLLTALVEDRKNACEPMMANMMSMMNMGKARDGAHDTSSPHK